MQIAMKWHAEDRKSQSALRAAWGKTGGSAVDELIEYMMNLLRFVPVKHRRYIADEIAWESRMLCVVGPRGVGKSTLFLQRIKLDLPRGKALYVTADHLYFAEHTLYEVAGEFERMGGTYLFIDEVHKYAGWSRELKNVYDAYPDLHVYVTGSSILDIVKGEADLSRRMPIYSMQGLSFREYLNISKDMDIEPYSFEAILAHKVDIPELVHPLPDFQEYLKHGYYPFGSDPRFDLELDAVVMRTLEVDIPQYANMTIATSRKLKQLMSIVSATAPFKPNITKLAARLEMSRSLVESCFYYMERAGLLMMLRTEAEGLGALGKTEKLYLDNTNLMYALGGGTPDRGNIRETFLLNQLRVKNEVRASWISDFEVSGITIEVGGRNKTGKQLQGDPHGIIAKDDIEHGHGKVVPLWEFGLTY